MLYLYFCLHIVGSNFTPGILELLRHFKNYQSLPEALVDYDLALRVR